jgi:hypothetical protein
MADSDTIPAIRGGLDDGSDLKQQLYVQLKRTGVVNALKVRGR